MNVIFCHLTLSHSTQRTAALFEKQSTMAPKLHCPSTRKVMAPPAGHNSSSETTESLTHKPDADRTYSQIHIYYKTISEYKKKHTFFFIFY